MRFQCIRCIWPITTLLCAQRCLQTWNRWHYFSYWTSSNAPQVKGVQECGGGLELRLNDGSEVPRSSVCLLLVKPGSGWGGGCDPGDRLPLQLPLPWPRVWGEGGEQGGPASLQTPYQHRPSHPCLCRSTCSGEVVKLVENEILLSDLPLPSIRSSSKSNANNSFKKHCGHLWSFCSGSVFCQNFGRGGKTAISSRHGEGQRGKSSLARNRRKKINIVVSGQVHLALQKIRQYWTSQEEIRYRREVLGMPDKYFHKMGTLQVALIGNSLHTQMYVLLWIFHWTKP